MSYYQNHGGSSGPPPTATARSVSGSTPNYGMPAVATSTYVSPSGFSSAKEEQDLLSHVRKATKCKETAPKQKHVRSCVVYTWDHKTSRTFWNALRLLNVYSEEVTCFKALIMIHKVLREGHPIILKEAQKEKDLLDSLKNYYTTNSYLGYASLIRHYVDFLYRKLDFHKLHPDFTGDFNYEEYISLRGVTDLNEGFLTVTELMQLQDDVDSLQTSVFASFTSSSNNECRISALVPLVEESYGLYLFITSMLRALHTTVTAMEFLAPLRDRYVQQFRRLQRFYHNSENLKYLTSLITVPKLPKDPPELFSRERLATTRPPEKSTSSQRRESPRVTEVGDDDLHKQLIALRNELENLRGNYRDSQALIGQYEQQLRNMDQDMRRLRHALQEQQLESSTRSHATQAFQDEINEWKAKYEKLAQMYAQLRAEHLELLRVHSECGNLDSQLKSTRQQLEQLKRSKDADLFDITRQRDKYKEELENLEGTHRRELERLQRDLAENAKKMEQMSNVNNFLIRRRFEARPRISLFGADGHFFIDL
jgi:huntingtin-interacting protein 1-related protein